MTTETTATAPVTIRPATPDDFDAAARLFQAMMGDGFALHRELWAEACARPDAYRVLVATDESGAVAGLAVLVVSDRIQLAAGTHRRRFHLDQLIVAPEQRRRGVAKALLEHVKAMAAEERPSYILVNCDFTNVAARRTYESAGLYLVRQAHDRFEIAFP
jgi:ribosomal protein S18 acetylase RimI-like enzyme